MAQRKTLSLQRGLQPDGWDANGEAADFKVDGLGNRAPENPGLRFARFRAALASVDTVVFILCFALTTLLSWFAGAFRTEFGGYPDEPAHYVTALMIRDYIAKWFPVSPLRFAEDYYIHYPKVAFGHWPPVFHSMQAVWMLLFGDSRSSILVLISLLMAGVAFLLYKIVKRYFGTAYGLWAALLYLLLTPVQFQTTLVMTEPALTLFGLLAVRSFARFLERDNWADATCFALWASLATLTKGDGVSFVLIVPLALLFAGKLRRLTSLRLWAALAAIALLCVPFTLWTLKMVKQGWVSQFSLTYVVQAAPAQAKVIFSTFGAMLATLALIGAAGSIRRHAQAPMFACMSAYGVGIVIFETLIPTSVEARKLLMAFPAILFLALCGARYLAQLLQKHVRPAWTAVLLIVLGTAAWASSSFTIVDRPEHGYRAVAQYILSNPALQDAVILVSSSEPPLGEGMLIAEIAEREPRPGHFVLRASKVIAHSDWTGAQNYRLLFTNSSELVRAFETIPVNVVVVDYPPTPESPLHHRFLLEAIRQNPSQWHLLYTGTDPAARGGARHIGVFQTNAPTLRRGLKLHLDLNETLGRSLDAPSQ